MHSRQPVAAGPIFSLSSSTHGPTSNPCQIGVSRSDFSPARNAFWRRLPKDNKGRTNARFLALSIALVSRLGVTIVQWTASTLGAWRAFRTVQLHDPVTESDLQALSTT